MVGVRGSTASTSATDVFGVPLRANGFPTLDLGRGIDQPTRKVAHRSTST
jgi:hypothetical protein